MTADQETPADQARRHADAAADGFRMARSSIDIALSHVEHVESVLTNTITRLPDLNAKALSLVMADDESGRQDEKTRAQAVAADLAGDISRAQRVLAGAPRDFDGVDRTSGAASELAKAAKLVSSASKELDKLAAVPGHDREAVAGLRAQAKILRSAAEEGQALLKGIQPTLDGARGSLEMLDDGKYLTSNLAPGLQAERVMAAGREAQSRATVAKGDVARAEGILSVADPVAREAARASAELAANKGLNPPVSEGRRTDAGSADGRAGQPGKERSTRGTGAHEV